VNNPWVAWYPGDYISKTRQLSMAQHGAYMLLLWEYYINGPLVADAVALLRVCGGKTEEDQVDMAYVLERFFTLKDGFYYNERVDEEIKKRATIRKRLQSNGKKGGLAKASNLLQPNASGSLACSQSQSHIKPKSKAKAQSAFIVPDWVPKEAWEHYEEMRRRIRKPMTDQARKWGLAKLAGLKAHGNDPTAVLEQSVFNSWQGLFPLKGVSHDSYPENGGFNGQRIGTQAQRAINNAAAIRAALGLDGDSDAVSPRQAPRLSSGNPKTLDAEIEEIPGSDDL
jgi:uncharacterized protein YdaU (DUF1376 family)